MMKELPKVYEPQQVESRIYQMWEDNDCFNGDPDPKKKPFSIVMPPPNVTGQLHMGHALDCTLQDILTRFKRMQGYSTLWVPGTDHAGIATQIKVEEELRVKEGLTRYDLGREKFLQRVWKWKEEYGNRIVEQQKKMGVSCDWSRSRFTMDEGCSKAVRETFCELYDKGLIYKGSRIINWCPHCITALSDAEVEYVDKPGHLWYIRYPLADGSGDIVVATTRPETMMGDTGVAVNPEDERFRDLVGKTCILPIMNREIPIVADDYVELGFGTGAVKMTPAHDPNDFEVGLRHNLEVIRCIGDDGRINENGGPYNGMDRYECRKQIVKDLEEQGYLVKTEPYSHNVGTCYRCHNDVEPLISAQWFVKMEPLAKEALRVVREGEVKFVPERFAKTYTNWMENVHDWCISRQLWWGHQIPAWTCDDCGHINVSREDPTKCEKCGSTHLTRDPDVLDTWFSSALWPFSTLGWPEKTADLDFYYPTSVMVTGYDIIFFWVARMIFSACEQTKKPPFHTVFIHGLVRDDKGRKMSKSLGNSPDPLELIEKYGADGVRMGMMLAAPAGNDILFDDALCEQGRNFCNKIWNAYRLVSGWTIDDNQPISEAAKLAISWFESKQNEVTAEVADLFSKYRLSEALMAVYKLFWDEFSSWFLEIIKPAYGQGIHSTVRNAAICYFDNLLRLLHPFMPFITEELWQQMYEREEGESIMVCPLSMDTHVDSEMIQQFEVVKEVISNVRSIRLQKNIAQKETLELQVVGENPVDAFNLVVMKMCNLSAIDVVDTKTEGAASFMVGTTEYAVPLGNMIDVEAEIARMEVELKHKEGFLQGVMKKLSNEKFVNNAPAAVLEMERKKQADAESIIKSLKESIAALKKA